MSRESEIRRIQEVYKNYGRSGMAERLWGKSAPSEILRNMRDAYFYRLLMKHGISSLASKKILDVGCGYGHFLDQLVRQGAEPARLFGLDIIPERVGSARSRSPAIHWALMDGTRMPFADDAFDILVQFTTFSSILDNSVLFDLAREMKRVLKPDGYIFSYDVRYNNFLNAATRAMGKGILRQCFPGCTLHYYSCTPPAPLVRMLGEYAKPMEKVPLLRSHYFTVIQQGESS